MALSIAVVTQAAIFFLLYTGYQLYGRYAKQNGKAELPPGPVPVPFLGNVHQLPFTFQQRTFAEWATTYGDIIYARLFHTHALVIDSVQAAQDLMDKRSSKYSDRPRFIMLQEVMGWHPISAFMGYGKRWRKHRQWIQAAFTDKAALMSYRPAQRREVYVLLAALLETPDQFLAHVKNFSAALIIDVVFGQIDTAGHKEHLRAALKATEATNEAGSLAAALVDFFPFLKHIPAWMPGGGFKRDALRIRALVQEVMDRPYDMVKTAIVSGTAKPSFVASLIENTLPDEWSKDHEEDIKGAAGVLYAAGIDTTTVSLWTFVLAMVLHPEYLRKAQEEMDRVIGNARLPEFEDRESLPYLECIVKEVYRWNPPVPLGVPHSLMEDDEYRGYHIPKGAQVIPNIWSMTHNKEFFNDPETFRPERFLEGDSSANAIWDPRKVIFGFGRRICPGRHFADANVWLAAANMIAAFDIRKARDATGIEITPPATFRSGFISLPEEFTCELRPRSTIPVLQVVSDMLNASFHHSSHAYVPGHILDADADSHK